MPPKIGQAGRKSEKLTAKSLGGTQTPASGASGMKGDIRYKTFSIECKSTIADSLSIKREWLLKVYREALTAGKIPALSLTFTDLDGQPRSYGTWVAVPIATFKELADLYVEYEEEQKKVLQGKGS